MHLLPTCLARLADMADRKDSTRFALGNVSLQLHADGTFTADATDSKCLVRVTGPSAGKVDEYPTFPALDAAPNGATRALVPAVAWRKAFGAAEKHTRKVARRSPMLGSVAVVAGDMVTTFGATDGENPTCETVVNGEGRFPPVADIISQSRKATRHRFAVDPLMLADLLRTLASVATDDCMRRVVFDFAAADKPVMIRVDGAACGLTATGVIMPLAGDRPVAPAVVIDSETVGVESGPGEFDTRMAESLTAANLRVSRLADERDAARRELATVRDELNRVRGELVAERAAARERDRSVALASGRVVVAPAEVHPAEVHPAATRLLTRAERVALIRAVAAPATV